MERISVSHRRPAKADELRNGWDLLGRPEWHPVPRMASVDAAREEHPAVADDEVLEDVDAGGIKLGH
ncbi:MAG: hypothetical protein V9F04_06030 [Dermatophilaceae bacterium]